VKTVDTGLEDDHIPIATEPGQIGALRVLDNEGRAEVVLGGGADAVEGRFPEVDLDFPLSFPFS
jgi:hypothetical protein